MKGIKRLSLFKIEREAYTSIIIEKLLTTYYS